MRQFLLYTGVALALVVVATVGVGFALDPIGRRSLVWAASIALTVQLAAFGVLLWARRRGNAFMLAFLGGGAARLGVLGVAGLLTTQTGTSLAAAPLLLGLAGYFFALLLLEGWFLRRSTRNETTE
jgi:hypothetical protein